MSAIAPIVDHVVINVVGGLDDAAAIYTGLGFQLTPRGHHSLGTSNHLAIFHENYLELLGHQTGHAGKQGAGWPAWPGLSGLVWKTGGADADEIYRHLQQVGLAGDPPESFFRPVTLPDGSQQEARFRTVRLAPARINNGRSFFCQQLTPELVWRAPWQIHPNGVTDIIGVVIATPNPAVTASLYVQLFAAAKDLIKPGEHGALQLQAGKTTLSFITPEQAREHFGPVAQGEDGSERMVALEFVVSSFDQTRRFFQQAGLGYQAEPSHRRLLIAAGAAFNVALAFTEI